MHGVSGRRGSQVARVRGLEERQQQSHRRRQVVEDDNTAARMVRQLAKTKMCHFWPHCRRRSRCPFAHSTAELRERPNLAKTSLCVKWVAGRCHLESKDCQFAHGYPDMRATEEFMQKPMGKHSHAQRQETYGEIEIGAVVPVIRYEFPAAPSGPSEQEAPPFMPQQSLSSGRLWAPAHGVLDHSASSVCPQMQPSIFAPEVAVVPEKKGTDAGADWDRAAKLGPRGGGEEGSTHRAQDGGERRSVEQMPSVSTSETSRLSTRGAFESSPTVDCFIHATTLHQHAVGGLSSQVARAAETRAIATAGEQGKGPEVKHVPREPEFPGEEGNTSQSWRPCERKAWVENCVGAQRPLSNNDGCSGGAVCSRCRSGRTNASSGCPSCASIAEVIGIIIKSFSEGNLADVTITVRL